jgi:hypothetical protein
MKPTEWKKQIEQDAVSTANARLNEIKNLTEQLNNNVHRINDLNFAVSVYRIVAIASWLLTAYILGKKGI